MKMKLKTFKIPANVYTARFEGVEECNHPEYGDGFRWKFTIVGGKHDGTEISRTTKTEPTAKNSAGKFLSKITGKDLSELKEEVDVNDYVDEMYLIAVGDTKDGSASKVDSIVRHVTAEDVEEGKHNF